MSFSERIYEVPEWKSFNKFILGGYRKNVLGKTGRYAGWAGLTASLTTWHNETVNIYTALFPLLIVLAQIVLVFSSEIPTSLSQREYLATLLGYAATFAGSTSYHLVNGGCPTRTSHALAADYAGIVFVIATSLYIPLGRAFAHCAGGTATLYQCAVVAAAAALLTTVVACRSLHGPHLRLVRAVAFSALAALGLLPQLHHYLTLHAHTVAIHHPLANASAEVHSLSLTLYAYMALGTIVYATKFPERYFPGRFDYLGASHQLWHLAIIAALVTHHRLVHRAAEVWPALPCP